MKHTAKKWITFSLRWGIAVAGITWVLVKTPFHDQLSYVDARNHLVQATVLNEPSEDDAQFTILDPKTGTSRKINREDVWTQPDRRSVKAVISGTEQKAKVVAIRPGAHHAVNNPPAELLVINPSTKRPVRIKPSQVPDGYSVLVPYPPVDIGVVRLVRHARLGYLLAALLVLPFSYLVTSRRWHLLLKAMDIHLSQARSFVLNMVGCFYNSFMPGSTGGDLIKAYYAAKHTTHKIRAVLSVIVDRVVGLLALIILGGVMALTQWQIPECRNVAWACIGLIAATVIGLIVFYHPTWRRASGLDWVMHRLPMQRHIHHAIEAMELYGKRPAAPFWGMVMTFPIHLTTILSALLAGMAFGLKMSSLYYFTAVPVIVLVSAIPLSPQGAGVMEFFAVQLTKNQGVTVSQAIALAMALRFGQMFWNLVAGLFVLRGGYHAPTAAEQQDLETDEEGPPDNPPEPIAKSESDTNHPIHNSPGEPRICTN